MHLRDQCGVLKLMDCGPQHADPDQGQKGAQRQRSGVFEPLVPVGVPLVGVLLAVVTDEEDQEILATLGNNLGAILTSVNLISQVRRQMERQRLLYDVTGKIRRAVDVSSVLQTSANEIGKALGARRAHIELSVPKTDLSATSNAPGGNGNGKEESK